MEDVLTLQLAGDPGAAARARRALSNLRGDLDEPLLENLRLLVTELVVNSVRHGRAEAVDLRVVVTPSSVLTEVSDEGPGFDPAGVGDPRRDETGWGLYLVGRVARRWGVAREGHTTRVWFELQRA